MTLVSDSVAALLSAGNIAIQTSVAAQTQALAAIANAQSAIAPHTTKQGQIADLIRYQLARPKILRPNMNEAVSANRVGGLNISGVSNWMGVAKWGNVGYMLPHNAADIMMVSLNGTRAPTFSRWTPGQLNPMTDPAKWASGVALPDGRIIGIPYNSQDILEITVTTQSAARTTYGLPPMVGDAKWRGAAFGIDGRVYCAPYNAQDILIIDPMQNKGTRWTPAGVDLSGTTKWSGAIQGLDGNVYCTPYSSNAILKIDVRAQTASLLQMPPANGNVWCGGAYGTDGKIYCPSRNGATSEILILDTESGSLTTDIMQGDSLSAVGGCHSSPVTGPDGLLYVATMNAGIAVIDPINRIVQIPPLNYTGSMTDTAKWAGLGVLDSYIIGAPWMSPDVLTIGPFQCPFSQQLSLSGIMNKF